MTFKFPIFHAITNSDLNVLNIELIKIILDYYSFADTLDKKLTGHTGRITCVTNLPNGNIITGSEDKKIKIWNAESGNCIKTLSGHKNYILCLNVLLDGRIISGSLDKTLKIWNPITGNCDYTSTKRGYSLTESGYYWINRIDVTNNGIIFVFLHSNHCAGRIETFNSETYNYEHHVYDTNNSTSNDNYVVVPSTGKIMIYSNVGTFSVHDHDSNTIYVLTHNFNEYITFFSLNPLMSKPDKIILKNGNVD